MARAMCRTCLGETNDSIFKTVFLAQKELSLVEMLDECMGLKVTDSDKISLSICENCTDQIINYYVYRKQCLDSNIVLLRQLEESQLDSIKCEAASDSEDAYEIVPFLSDTAVEVSNDCVPKNNEPTDSGTMQCDLCDNIFSNRSLLLNHLYNAHSIIEYQKYECVYCKKQYRSLNNMRRHITSVHESDVPKYICDHCGQKFKNRVHLTSHVRRHTGEKPYKCDFCGYRATQQTCVTVHMRTHTGERPYKCDVCGKLFRTSSTRANHRRGHSDEVPYECIVCLKKFKKKYIYREHMVIHNPDKYIECKFCGKKFARTDNLKFRIKQHTGEKPHVCEYCEYRYDQRPGQQPQLVQVSNQPTLQCTVITQHPQHGDGQQQQTTSRPQTTFVPQSQIQQQPQMQQQNPQTNRKGLSLKHKHYVDAQAIFQNANVVTRVEKAVILGFMAGFRENPKPSLDNTIVIKLGDTKQKILQENGSYVITSEKSFIKLDYNTGEWKTFKEPTILEQHHEEQNSIENSVAIN